MIILRMSEYHIDPIEYECTKKCPYNTTQGCVFPVASGKSREPANLPSDKVCQFPRVHVNGVENFVLNLGGFEDGEEERSSASA